MLLKVDSRTKIRVKIYLFSKKFKNIPRWLRLILAAIMIPFFPVLGLLGIALGIVIVIVLTMVITIGLLWKFFASFK